MQRLLKLSSKTLLHQKLGVLVLLLAVIVPLVFPVLTSAEGNSGILAPARAQAAWQFAWVGVFFYLLFQAANLSSQNSKSGMGAYFLSGGMRPGKQLLAMWLSCMVYGLLLCLIPALVCIFMAAPAHPDEYKHWLVLSVQAFSLMFLVVGSLVMFSLALASRFGATVGYLFALGLLLTGKYGVVIIGKIVMAKDFVLLDGLYGVLPHYYLADVTHRFVHKQGAMTTPEYLSVFEYIAGWSLLVTCLSCLIFSPKQK